jgi:hypothetical protein
MITEGNVLTIPLSGDHAILTTPNSRLVTQSF